MPGNDAAADLARFDVTVLKNLREARENGYDLACSSCGCGMSDEDFDAPDYHEQWCPNRSRDRGTELEQFISDRLGSTAPADE